MNSIKRGFAALFAFILSFVLTNDKINDKINNMANMKLNLSAMDESIIQLIRDNAYITVPEIAEQVGKAQATVYRHILTVPTGKPVGF